MYIHEFHLLFVFPMLYYVVYLTLVEQRPLPLPLAYFILLLACVGVFYHVSELKK